MLKKKINGVWQNCYKVKRARNGSWYDLNYQTIGYPGLSRYTNGSWVRIYFPEITIIGYSFGTSGGNNEVYCLRQEGTYFKSEFGVSDSYYYGSSTRTTKGYFGTFPAVSGDILECSLDYENTSSSYGSTNVIIRLVNFSSESSTSYSTIRTIIDSSSSTQSGYTFNYTFSSSYNNVGFYIETKASAGSGSTASSANATIDYLVLNNNRIYVPTISYENN